MRRLILAGLVLALAAPPGAEASIDRSRYLWATVNICDSEQSPDTVGIRASMPGSGRKRERMYMRFRVQFRSQIDGQWHDFSNPEGTRSAFVRVGSARYRARQSGWTFPFELEPGQQYELRGVVNFQWRRGSKVVRKATRRTTSGHRTAVAEPRNYSAATCVLKG